MRIIFFSILITSTLVSESLKDMTFKNATVSKVTSIYDGDTFRADIKGYPPIGRNKNVNTNKWNRCA